MLHTFKLYGTCIAIDTESGAVHTLDALGFDMLRYLTFPLENNCLSTLRYDLAKYESSDVASTFERFSKMYRDGVFYSESETASKYFSISAPKKEADFKMTVSASHPIFASEIIKAADAGAKTLDIEIDTNAPVAMQDMDIIESELERIAKEIAKRKLGKIDGIVFDFLPFDICTTIDENGYVHIADERVWKLFSVEPSDIYTAVGRKNAECGLMLDLL